VNWVMFVGPDQNIRLLHPGQAGLEASEALHTFATTVVVANVVVTAEPVAGDAVVKAFVVEQGQGTIPVG